MVRPTCRRRLSWRASAALATIALAMPCGAERAEAGTYSVSSCRLGWVPDVRNAPGEDGPYAYDDCDRPERGIYALFQSVSGQSLAAGDYAGWRFNAPPDTAIVALTVRWNGHGDAGAGQWGTVDAMIEASTTFGGPFHNAAFDATDSVDLTDATWVRLALVCHTSSGSTSCRGQTDVGDVPGRFFVRASTVTLADRFAPVVQSVDGAAVKDGTWTDLEPLAFSASDRGGGVYRVLVEADGKTVDALPAVSDARCSDETGGRTFAYPVPCPTQASGTASIDASRLPSGWHTVAVYLEDAAGNRTTLVTPRPRLIVNDARVVGYFANGQFFNPRFASPRVINGDNAASGAKLTATFVRQVGKGKARHSVRRVNREVRYSQRATVRGRLTTPSGEPIRHATVFVGQQPEGEQWRLDGTARTNAKGAFVYRPPARRPSRHLRAVYFPYSDSNENVASGVLKLGVRAGLTLHVNHHHLRNGDRVVFTGRVLGPVPAAGVAVTLQAKVGRHYRSFRQLRATSRTNGRVRTVYRFERTTQPARYRFRLKLVRQAGLPFQSGVSPVVSVSVRP